MEAVCVRKLDDWRDAYLWELTDDLYWTSTSTQHGRTVYHDWDTRWVITSSIDDESARETLVFPANADGDVVCWRESARRRQRSHERVLVAIGCKRIIWPKECV